MDQKYPTTYRICADPQKELEDNGFLNLDRYELLSDLFHFLSNHRLELVYSGSGDSGDIDQVFLDDEEVTFLNLDGIPTNIYDIGDVLFDLISLNTWIYISFDSSGSKGRLRVTREDNLLVIVCDHTFCEDPASSYVQESGLSVSINHTSLFHLRQALNDEIPPIRTYEELANLFYLLGLKKVLVDKSYDCLNFEISLEFEDDLEAETTNEILDGKMPTFIAKVIEYYVTHGTDIRSIEYVNCSLDFGEPLDISSIQLSMTYEKDNDDEYSFNLNSEVFLPDRESSQVRLEIVFKPFEEDQEFPT